jgi:hypothetical protein
MPTLQEVRAQYPQYGDLSDEQLADGLHKKFYSDMPKADFLGKIGAAPKPTAAGQLEAGNIDLAKRPVVKNPDGSISTVRSASFNMDGAEVLIPTVSDDGRVVSDQEAIQLYRKTGKHLGKFATPDAATKYAESLHRKQEEMYVPKPATSVGKLYGSMENDISAAMQGTTPHVRKFDGSLNYEPLGELIEADFGPAFKGPDGQWVPVDPKQHVMLQDPQTSRQMIYKRDPAKEEGAITRIARMALPGMATIAPSRLAGGIAPKVAGALDAAPTEQAQAILAAQRQGIKLPPSAATDNFAFQAASKKLSDIEGIGTPIRKGINQAADAVKTGVVGADPIAGGGAAGAFGSSRTLEQAGEAILEGVDKFGAPVPKQYPSDRFSGVLARPLGQTGLRAKQDAAYSQVRQAIPKDAVGGLDNARLAIQDLRIKDAEAGVPLQVSGQIGKIVEVIDDPAQQLSFNGIQRLRTLLREAQKSGEVKTISDREWQAIYNGLSKDMYTLAERAGGPRAATMLGRADQLTKFGEERLEKVLKPLGQKTAEGAAGTLLQWAQPGKQGALAKLRATRRSVDEDTWNELSSAAIYQMGQGRDGMGFSLNKLVSEYEKLTPDAKEVLFRSTGKNVVAQNLDDLVEVAKAMKKVEAMGNPSGSGRYAVSAGIYGTAAASAMMGDILTPLSLIGGGRLAAHVLASPKLTGWVTGAARIQRAARTADPASLPQYQKLWVSHLGQLRLMAAENPEIAPGLAKLANSLAGEEDQTGPAPQETPPAPQ